MLELVFLVQTLASFILGLFLLRLLFQIQKVDFRNPVAQSVVRLTNPVILPLRRVLPAIGRAACTRSPQGGTPTPGAMDP